MVEIEPCIVITLHHVEYHVLVLEWINQMFSSSSNMVVSLDHPPRGCTVRLALYSNGIFSKDKKEWDGVLEELRRMQGWIDKCEDQYYYLL
jgi:hypothetical protein